MARLRTNKDKIILVDPEDYSLLSRHTWGEVYAPKSKTTYVGTTIQAKSIRIHRLILGSPANWRYEVDHINGNGLDNRKCNLRYVFHGYNNHNKHQNKRETSRYTGVYRVSTKSERWQVYVDVDHQHIYFGCFKNQKVAAQAYDDGSEFFYGDRPNNTVGGVDYEIYK